MLTFVDPPAAISCYLRGEYGPLLSGAGGAAVEVRFAPPSRPARNLVMEMDGVRTVADANGRFWLLDGRGHGAQLPVSGAERELWVDPELSTARNDATHQYVHRLLEWRLASHGMVMLKAAAVTLAEGTVAVCGFDGAGKTSTTLALLEQAKGYIGEERVVLLSHRTVAAFPTPIKLSLGRYYVIGDQLARRLQPHQRRLLRLAPAAGRGPRRVRGRLREELARRWVSVDPCDVFPDVPASTTAPLDSLVFLLPMDGGDMEVERLHQDEARARARQQTAYFDINVLPLRTMFGYAFPRLAPWPVSTLDALVERVGVLMGDVPAWGLRFPRGAPAAELAAAVTSTLTPPPGSRRALLSSQG